MTADGTAVALRSGPLPRLAIAGGGALLLLVLAAVWLETPRLPHGAGIGGAAIAAGSLTVALAAVAYARGASRRAADCARRLAAAEDANADIVRMLDGIADAIFLLDHAWRIRFANAASLAQAGRDREGAAGALLWDLFPDLRGSEFVSRLEAAARAPGGSDFVALVPPLDGWFEVRAFPVGGGLWVFCHDITAERDGAERQRQARKLESLGQLTGGIAHDVNNLLTVMLGSFEMLALSAEERGEAGAADGALAEAGLRAGESASQLMHRLLAFSRRRPLSPQVVDVGALLASLGPLLRRTIGETVSLRISAPDDLWKALADPAELETAILNLAINARDAMPEGGQLSIAASNVAMDRVYAALAGLDRTGEFIIVSVADTGGGMPREVLERAFDPFFTTKEPGRGTGLGLSTVYGFARQSGGHVTIDSERGKGTIVRLYLPRTRDTQPLDAPGTARGVDGGTERILLVEDNEHVREHSAAMLRRLGYSVHVASDAAEALLLLQEGLRPDLVVADLVLPGGMSGREVADAAAALVPSVRVLFTSGLPGHACVEDWRASPGGTVLGKPFRRSELAAAVRRQLAGPAWQASMEVPAWAPRGR